MYVFTVCAEDRDVPLDVCLLWMLLLLQNTSFPHIIPSLQEILSTLATAVASSTQALITHAQKIASLSEDQAMKDKIYAAIKETADATQGLLTAANMVGSSADYSLCQEQLTEACKKAIGKVEKLVLTAQVSQVEHQWPCVTSLHMHWDDMFVGQLS